jgi:hypothetical protein
LDSKDIVSILANDIKLAIANNSRIAWSRQSIDIKESVMHWEKGMSNTDHSTRDEAWRNDTDMACIRWSARALGVGLMIDLQLAAH